MKRKSVSQALALLLTMTMVLAGCGSSTAEAPAADKKDDAAKTEAPATNDKAEDKAEEAPATEDVAAAGEPIKDLVITTVGDLPHMVMQHSEGSGEGQLGGNCLSPLLEYNKYGQLCPAVATEWGTEDGSVWTFNLRDDIVYVDYQGNEIGQCNAWDWITSLEWVLNFHKNGGLCTSMPTSTIKGAEEYYEYTKTLSEEEGKAIRATDAVFLDMVGIEAPDDYTLKYTMIDKCAYFDTLCAAQFMYPMPQGMIDNVGVDGLVGITFEDFWYSGPYRLTTWVLNNEKVFTKNDKYWDKEATLFDTVTMKCVEDNLTDDLLWSTGETHVAQLDVSTLTTIAADPSHPDFNNLTETRIEKYSWSCLFNYDKKFADGTPDENWNKAIGNEAFRQTMNWGLNWTNCWYLDNAINPFNLENNAYTANNLGVFSDGKDFTTRVVELLDLPEKVDEKTPRRYVPEKAAEYKAQAIEELTAEGVTFPVKLDYYIKAGNQSELDTAIILEEIFEELGTDFIDFNILTYVSSYGEEVMFPQMMSMAIVGWGADFGDVSNFVDQCKIYDDAAIYSVERLCTEEMTDEDTIAQWKEFTELADKAGAINNDRDARLEAYAEAEAYMIGHALVIPAKSRNKWQLTHVNDYSKPYSASGISDVIWKNWETSTVPYTTEDYARFKAEYEAGVN